jgi:hypothetical protein
VRAFEQVARVARACVVMLESLRWLSAHAGAAPLEGGQSQRNEEAMSCHRRKESAAPSLPGAFNN